MLYPRFAFVVLALGAAGTAHAEVRLGGALGFQHWSAISELEPAAGGNFESGAVVLDASVHWRLQRFPDRRIAIGLQAGGGGDYSSIIVSFVGDLRASTSYTATSAIVSIADNAFMEFGVGSYRVTMRDSRVIGLSDLLPPGAPSSKVHEQREPGFFFGGGMELGAGDRFAWTIGAKLHFPDFGDVPELGPNAGSLSDPMITLQFGLRYLL